MTRARIVFDLDGTLIDSAPDIRHIANAVLAEADAKPITLAETHSFIGNGVGVFVSRMRALRNISEDRQEQMVESFVRRYETQFEHTSLYPDTRPVLTQLQAQHSLGICTNKVIGATHAVLGHLKIDHLFGCVIGGDSLPTRKPDPQMLFAAFEALDGGPEIYVGDSEVDAETAQRAGVPFFLFSGGYRKTGVDQIPKTARFDSFSELPGLVESLIAG